MAPIPDQGNGQRTDEKDDGQGEKFGVEFIIADEKFDGFQEDEPCGRIGDSSAPDMSFPELPGEVPEAGIRIAHRIASQKEQGCQLYQLRSGTYYCGN